MRTLALLSALRRWFTGTEAVPPSPCVRIEALLDRLQRRELQLEQRLRRERRAAKRRRLNQALQVIRLQRRKGIEKRSALGPDCDN